MRLHSPSMSELHAFVTAARLGSFTRAAEVLCVTQGAVSRAISRLEAHFGQPLMHRNAHGLTLTETGRRLYDGTLGPLQQIEALSAGLRANDRRLRLTLSTVPTLASAWLVPRLSDFHARHPDIQLSFAAYRRNEDFSGATPDASILSGMPEQWPGWQVDYVIGRELVVICHPAPSGGPARAGTLGHAGRPARGTAAVSLEWHGQLGAVAGRRRRAARLGPAFQWL